MTHDVIALTRGAPTGTVLLESAAAVAPHLHIAGTAEGNAVQLFHPGLGLVATIENPIHVRTRGEAARLLELDDPPRPPYWWLEIRSPVFTDGAAEIADAIAGEVTHRVGGTVWRSAAID